MRPGARCAPRVLDRPAKILDGHGLLVNGVRFEGDDLVLVLRRETGKNDDRQARRRRIPAEIADEIGAARVRKGDVGDAQIEDPVARECGRLGDRGRDHDVMLVAQQEFGVGPSNHRIIIDQENFHR